MRGDMSVNCFRRRVSNPWPRCTRRERLLAASAILGIPHWVQAQVCGAAE